jgi:hypothetical protein
MAVEETQPKESPVKAIISIGMLIFSLIAFITMIVVDHNSKIS